MAVVKNLAGHAGQVRAAACKDDACDALHLSCHPSAKLGLARPVRGDPPQGDVGDPVAHLDRVAELVRKHIGSRGVADLIAQVMSKKDDILGCTVARQAVAFGIAAAHPADCRGKAHRRHPGKDFEGLIRHIPNRARGCRVEIGHLHTLSPGGREKAHQDKQTPHGTFLAWGRLGPQQPSAA